MTWADSSYVRSRQSSARLGARGRAARIIATRAERSIGTMPRSPVGRSPTRAATTATMNARQVASRPPKPCEPGELPAARTTARVWDAVHRSASRWLASTGGMLSGETTSTAAAVTAAAPQSWVASAAMLAPEAACITVIPSLHCKPWARTRPASTATTATSRARYPRAACLLRVAPDIRPGYGPLGSNPRWALALAAQTRCGSRRSARSVRVRAGAPLLPR